MVVQRVGGRECNSNVRCLFGVLLSMLGVILTLGDSVSSYFVMDILVLTNLNCRSLNRQKFFPYRQSNAQIQLGLYQIYTMPYITGP